jgi:thiamine biosynthesis lipoprotein
MQLQQFPFRAMGSPCALHLYAPDRAALDAAAEAGRGEVARLERKYSRYRDDSVVAGINRSAGDAAGVEVDPETAGLLDYARTAFRTSGGLFDVTSGVLRRAWDFKSGRLPRRKEVRQVLRLVGLRRVRWRRPRLVLPLGGMQIDFGGCVKEYAADRVCALLRRGGIRHGLVDLGGDLSVIGPHPDGSPWIVGIRHPRLRGQVMASLRLERGGVATSGDYERCMLVDGVRYGHILSPKSGWPVDGLITASVSASHCLLAGTASTVAMLKGAAGARWLEQLGLPCVWMDREGRVGCAQPGSEAVVDRVDQAPGARVVPALAGTIDQVAEGEAGIGICEAQ